MLVRPQEESTELETYLSPLFSSYPDIFLQPVTLNGLNDNPIEARISDENVSLEYLL